MLSRYAKTETSTHSRKKKEGRRKQTVSFNWIAWSWKDSLLHSTKCFSSRLGCVVVRLAGVMLVLAMTVVVLIRAVLSALMAMFTITMEMVFLTCDVGHGWRYLKQRQEGEALCLDWAVDASPVDQIARKAVGAAVLSECKRKEQMLRMERIAWGICW